MTSLHARVRRLESAVAPVFDRAAAIKRGREESMLPGHAEADHARCIAALSEPDLTGFAGEVQQARRRLGRHFLAESGA